jgi:hypothetical protein
MADKAIDLKPAPASWSPGEDTETHDDPLLECLVQLTRLHGRPASKTALVAGLPLVKNRLTVELFARAAERADLAARVVKRPLKKISALQLPALLLLNDGQACLLVERNAQVLRLSMPEAAMGVKDISAKELEALYSGYAIFVRPKFRPERKSLEEMGYLTTRSWFWGTLFKSWRIYRDVFVASFLINLFGLASPFFVLNVYDRVIPNNAVETLWVLAIGISVIYVFAVIMRGLRGYFVDEVLHGWVHPSGLEQWWTSPGELPKEMLTTSDYIGFYAEDGELIDEQPAASWVLDDGKTRYFMAEVPDSDLPLVDDIVRISNDVATVVPRGQITRHFDN